MQAPRTQTPVQAPTQDDTHDGLLNILSDDSVQPHYHVIIIHSMDVIKCMKKRPGMKKIINFTDEFVKRITRMVKPYDEGRIIYDRYDIAQSLKQKTRAKRAHRKEMEFAIHDEKDIAKITLKELLKRQRRSSPTFLVMPYWRNTKDRRKRWWWSKVPQFRSIILTPWLIRCPFTIMRRQTP